MVQNMSCKIYMDHAATTEMLPQVRKAMEPYLMEEYGNASTSYEMGRRTREALEGASYSFTGNTTAFVEIEDGVNEHGLAPDHPGLDGQDYVVLNSTSNLSKAIRPLGGYGRIHCFLDNDKAGMEAVQELREEYGLRVRDASHIYGGYNDLNDFLCGKRSGQAERRQEKQEPEGGQRQARQPKNKGIRM